MISAHKKSASRFFLKIFVLLFLFALCFKIFDFSIAAPALPEPARNPYWAFYETASIPTHDPVPSDGMGLKWEMPLRTDELPGRKIVDLGGVFCPTMEGRVKGPWANRYRGIHRGHDIGTILNRLGDRKIPVHVIADGVYDGQRTYPNPEHQPLECKPLVVYHSSQIGGGKVYTSLYCHVDPLPGLKVGQKLNRGDIIGTIEDPKGAWNAHVHIEIYERKVYSSKDSTKRDRCGCLTDEKCDEQTRRDKEIPRGCGIFDDDLYLIEPVLFIQHFN